MLKEIEDYNRYDCRSTRRLRDWLISSGDRIAACRPWAPQPVADGVSGRGRPTSSPASLMAVRGRRGRQPHPGTDGRRADRRGPRIPPARGQAVLVGALRPAQQSRRRVGRQQRRVRRREGRGRQGLASCRRRAPGRPSGWVKLTGALAAGGLKSRRVRAVRPARHRPASPTTPTDVAAGNAEIIVVDDPSLPDRGHHLSSGSPGRRAVHAAAVRADARLDDPDEKAARVHRRGGRRSRRRPARTARHRDRRHPAAPHPRTRSGAPLPHTGDTADGHHRRAARPRLVVPRGARPARHRQDVSPRHGHRARSSTTTTGGSASSRSRMPSSRTCSAT